MALDWNQGALAAGLECYRRQQFFETHEYWESVWVRTAEPEKTFLQALIHVSVAFHHVHCGNSIGAERQLHRAQRKLADYPAMFAGIDVDEVRTSIASWLKAIESGEALDSVPYPLIV